MEVFSKWAGTSPSRVQSKHTPALNAQHVPTSI